MFQLSRWEPAPGVESDGGRLSFTPTIDAAGVPFDRRRTARAHGIGLRNPRRVARSRGSLFLRRVNLLDLDGGFVIVYASNCGTARVARRARSSGKRMNDDAGIRIQRKMEQQRAPIVERWLQYLQDRDRSSVALVSTEELRRSCEELFDLLRDGLSRGGLEGFAAPVWDATRLFLEQVSSDRAVKGLTPTETANYVLSLRQPLYDFIGGPEEANREGDANDLRRLASLIDEMGLYTTEAYLRTRERLINRQREEMLELSTPVVRLWKGILAVPLIGTLDSERTQVVMETLLTKVIETEATIAIIDITGVPTVDTLVAQHLLKTVSAARLMGADCIISGISPQIAQTIVHLGVDLGDVTTRTSLESAFGEALRKMRLEVCPVADSGSRE